MHRKLADDGYFGYAFALDAMAMWSNLLRRFGWLGTPGNRVSKFDQTLSAEGD
jgi:hypothetical protein